MYILAKAANLKLAAVWSPMEHLQALLTVLPRGLECIPSSCSVPQMFNYSCFQAVTKDQESVLLKQQEDIGYLSRHLDHVINFTKWATSRNGCTALLNCKRLVRLTSSQCYFPNMKISPALKAESNIRNICTVSSP